MTRYRIQFLGWHQCSSACPRRICNRIMFARQITLHVCLRSEPIGHVPVTFHEEPRQRLRYTVYTMDRLLVVSCPISRASRKFRFVVETRPQSESWRLLLANLWCFEGKWDFWEIHAFMARLYFYEDIRVFPWFWEESRRAKEELLRPRNV